MVKDRERRTRLHRRKSLKSRLFVVLAVFSILPILAVSYASQKLMFRSSVAHSASLSQQIVDLFANELENQFKGVNRLLEPLMIDLDFQKYLSVSKEDTIAQLKYSRSFQAFFDKMSQANQAIMGILYLDLRGKTYYHTTRNETIYHRYDFEGDSTYREIYDMERITLLPPHERPYITSNNAQTIAIVKPVLDFYNHEVHSWIVVELEPARLLAFMKQTDFGHYGEAYLYHAESGGTIVLAEGSGLGSGRPLAELAEAYAAQETTFLYEREGRTYQVAGKRLSIEGWTLLGIAPLDKMVEGTEQASRMTLLVGIVLVVFAVAASLYLINLFLKPLERLKSSIVKLGKKRETVKVPHTSYEEIDFLIKAYNGMLDNLSQMEETVVQARMRENEKELLQLQAYINPHFLFNTLETIAAFAFRHEGEKAEKMVHLVAHMMRFNIRADGGLATLEEEFRAISDLLAIHRYRTQSEIDAELDAVEAALSARIMKLSVQPFVENALKYGYRSLSSRDRFQLSVRAAVSAEGLTITIRDNGQGMPPEVLDKYRKLIQTHGGYEDDFFRRHTGIYNVYRRFQLAYGDNFKIDMVNGKDRGLEVSIRLGTIKERGGAIGAESVRSG